MSKRIPVPPLYINEREALSENSISNIVSTMSRIEKIEYLKDYVGRLRDFLNKSLLSYEEKQLICDEVLRVYDELKKLSKTAA
jgi:hypothetical protein